MSQEHSITEIKNRLSGLVNSALYELVGWVHLFGGKDRHAWIAYSKRIRQAGLPRFIDCDANPFLPDGWKVEEHKKGGRLAFDPTKIEFYLDDGQKGGKYIVGHKLRKELADKPVMNANVLDFLLANPDPIPEDWKTDGAGNPRYIFFWGTVYRDRDGNLYVRYLYWNGGRWHWSSHWLDYDFNDHCPALLRAS